MLEEALPLAIGVGAALLPAMAFGGLAAARAFMYLGAAECGFLQALEDGKSEEEAMKLITGEGQPVIASPLERRAPAPVLAAAAAPAAIASALERAGAGPSFGFAARFLQ